MREEKITKNFLRKKGKECRAGETNSKQYLDLGNVMLSERSQS